MCGSGGSPSIISNLPPRAMSRSLPHANVHTIALELGHTWSSMLSPDFYEVLLTLTFKLTHFLDIILECTKAFFNHRCA